MNRGTSINARLIILLFFSSTSKFNRSFVSGPYSRPSLYIFNISSTYKSSLVLALGSILSSGLGRGDFGYFFFLPLVFFFSKSFTTRDIKSPIDSLSFWGKVSFMNLVRFSLSSISIYIYLSYSWIFYLIFSNFCYSKSLMIRALYSL